MTRVSSWLILLAVTIATAGCGGGSSDPIPATNPTPADPNMELSADGAGNQMEKGAIE